MIRFLVCYLIMLLLPLTTINGQMASLVKNPQINKLPVRSVHCILQDSEGYVWYGTVNGLCRDDGYNIQVFRNDYLHPQPMKSNLIFCITEDSLRRIVFGTPSGAFYIDKNDYKITPFFPDVLGEKSIDRLLTKTDGSIWVYASNEEYIIEGEQIKRVETYTENKTASDPYEELLPYHDLQVADNGTVWTISAEGLMAYKSTSEGGYTSISLEKELRGYAPELCTMVNMVKFRDGSLWVAGYDCESFFIDFEEVNRLKFDLPIVKERFNRSPLIVTICKNAESTYWLSQDNVGLCLYDSQNNEFTTYKDYASTAHSHLNTVHELTASHTPHHVWALADSNYVYGISSMGMEMKLEHTIPLTEKHRPKTIFEDASGMLWIGTYGGILTYNPLTKKLSELGEETGYTTSFTQTKDGHIWATITGMGVIEISNGKVINIYEKHTDLLCISSTSDGTIWVGTGTGELLRLSNGQFSSLSEKAGMNGDMVEKIVADKHDHLWVLTNQRITEFDPENNVYKVIKSESGQSNFSLPRFMPRSISRDSAGNEIVIGGFDGFLVCSPSDNINSTRNSAKVHITDMKVSGRSVVFDLGKTLNASLPANAQNIEIQISALDHLHSSVIRYAYRFDDGEWNYLPVGRNSIQIKQFEKGNHTLQIKSTDKNGIWSTNITEFDIFREPYWYETYTAYAIYVLLFVLAIFAIIRYFILRTRKQEEAIWGDSAELVEMRRYIDEKPSSNHDSTEGRDQNFTQIDKMLLSKIKETVEQHIGEPDFNVATLADHMNMSRSTLMRKIKVITGKTPLQIIRDIKIESACQMLKNHTTSVSEVAHRLGYTDSDYFSKTFRESVGMSPSEWQRQNLTLEE